MKSSIRELLAEDKNVFGLPNILTLSRLGFLPFVLYFLWMGTATGDRLALLFMLLASFTDFLDGLFARKLNMTSQLGRLLDPLIDKLSVASVMLLLAMKKGLPAWFVAIVIGRDLFILLGSMLVIKRKRTIMESNMPGKFTAASLVLVIILYTLQVPIVKEIALWISIILIPFSLLIYFFNHMDTIIRKSVKLKEKIESLYNSK